MKGRISNKLRKVLADPQSRQQLMASRPGQDSIVDIDGVPHRIGRAVYWGWNDRLTILDFLKNLRKLHLCKTQMLLSDLHRIYSTYMFGEKK